MTYAEFENAVYNECLKDKTTETYKDDFENIFEEMKPRTKKHFEDGDSVADTAWGICLLI